MYPSVHQSSNFQGTQGKMSKRGSPFLRRAAYLAANAARRFDSVFKEHYEKIIAREKHPNQSLGVVPTKLLRVIHIALKAKSLMPLQNLSFLPHFPFSH